MKKIILVGTLPIDESNFTYTDGQAESFQYLVEILSKENIFNIVIIDILRKSKITAQSKLINIFELLKILFRAASGILFSKKSILYITSAQSFQGIVRDSLFVILGRLRGHRIFLHVHGGGIGEEFNRSILSKTIGKFIYNSAEKIIVLDNFYRKMFDDVLLNHNKLFILENFIQDRAFRTEKNSTVNILYMSNLVESKGYLIALEAAKKLKESGLINFRFKFCGNFIHSERRTLQEQEKLFLDMISKYDLIDNVSYEGNVMGAKKDAIFFNSDFFILPSSYPNEGIPLSIIEALSYGCIVLTSNHRALPGMIENNISGFALDLNSSAFAEKILKILENNELESLRVKANTFYKKKYSYKKAKNQIINLFS